MNITADQITADLRRFLTPSYPEIDVHVTPWETDPARLAIYFTDPKFAWIYPYQRWHYLTHLIPAEYQKGPLENSVWFELAPGEEPDDLQYPDEELIDAITHDVMKCLRSSCYFELLDDAMCPQKPEQERCRCRGDFRCSRPILLSRGFKEHELFDVFHVLMRQGGFCDCEVLYNVLPESRLKAEYWTERSQGPSRQLPPTVRDEHKGQACRPDEPYAPPSCSQ
jgi:Protein of unknown function (DUF2695)